MSYPYNRFYANNAQRGHQLYYDQVLEGFPLKEDPNYVVGGYLANGATFSKGQACSVKVDDTHYTSLTQGGCSTWASAPPKSANVCCVTTVDTSAELMAPVMVFPVTIEEELAAAMGRNC